jgi:hypothetical protein
MRHLIISLLAVLLAAPMLSATETHAPVEVLPQVVPAAPAAEVRAEMHLDVVEVRTSAATEDAEATQLGPRGGFWWMVGVIVVAGVILAVIL